MLTGIIAFLLLLIVLLAIPVSVSFQMSWPQHTQNKIVLRWLFGLVRISFNPFKSTAPSPVDEALAEKFGHLERSSDKSRNGLSPFRQKIFRRRIIRFVRDIWQAVHKRDVRLHLRIGLGDPADTGQLWVLLGPMAGILANTKAASIVIEPDFIDASFELDSSGTLQLMPLQLFTLILGLLLSPSVWQGLRQSRKVVA